MSIRVALDGEPFDEPVARLDEFYERLRAGAAATTSLPSPAELLAAYERVAKRGAKAVVSIHLDARTSGTVGAAELAGRESPVPVSVVDTKTASFGVALSVRAAAYAISAGGSADDAARAGRAMGARLDNVFAARLSPGGHVPARAAWAVLRFRNGRSTPIAQCSTECSSAEEAAEAMAARVPPGSLAAVGHAARELEPAADELAHALGSRGCTVERYRVGAAVGAHTGPDSFGAFWRSRT